MKIDASDFAAEQNGMVTVGIHRARAAAALRRMADEVESGGIMLQSASLSQTAVHDDFTRVVLRLRYAEKVTR